ncbi:hypothetical protein V5799_027822 [Amblyomma americanum]|uniref:Peptidase M13 C-terminal domain-containing protein n=1 Tax=Amblyomma americanum TaxID=6943 RepID=A0AAQ4DEM3_AMBAM
MAEPETEPEAEPEAEHETEPEAEPEAERGAEPEEQRGAEPEEQRGAEPEAETESAVPTPAPPEPKVRRVSARAPPKAAASLQDLRPLMFLDDNAFVWHRLSEKNVARNAVSALERLLVFAVRWRLPLLCDVVYVPGAAAEGTRDIYLTPSPLTQSFSRVLDELNVWVNGGVSVVWEAMLVAASRKAMTDVDREWASRTVALQSRLAHLFQALRQAPGRSSGSRPGPKVIPLIEMATVKGSLSPGVWTSALQAALRVNPAVSVHEDVLRVVDTRVLETIEMLFAENDELLVLATFEFSIALYFGTMILSDAAAYLRTDRYRGQVLEHICSQQVQSVFAFPLVQYDKTTRSPEELYRLHELLDAVKNVVLQKVEGADWPPELRAAIARHVNATTTVLWGEKGDDDRDDQLLHLYSLYYNVPMEGHFYFQRWSSAIQYVDDWLSQRRNVRLLRIRRSLQEELVDYDPVENTVTLSPVAVGPPFFYGRAPNAVLYGGVGYLYARELTRAVDYAESLLGPTFGTVRPGAAVGRLRRNAALPSDPLVPAQTTRRQPWSTGTGRQGEASSMAEITSLTTEPSRLLNSTLANVSNEAAAQWVQVSETAFPSENAREEAEPTLSSKSSNISQLAFWKSETSSSTSPLRRIRRRSGSPAENTTSANWTQLRRPSGFWKSSSPGASETPQYASSTSSSKPTSGPALQLQQPSCSWKGKLQSAFLDVAALKVTYTAFKKLLRLGENVRLMELRQFSTEQLFFLSVCYTGCRRNLRPQATGCNEALINEEAFAKAFACRPGTFMNPVERCPLPWPRVSGH